MIGKKKDSDVTVLDRKKKTCTDVTVIQTGERLAQTFVRLDKIG